MGKNKIHVYIVSNISPVCQSSSNRCQCHTHIHLVLTMEVNLNLPVPARWVPGQRAGSNILVDPYNVKMWPKSSDTNNKYFICSRRRDLGCMVQVRGKPRFAFKLWNKYDYVLAEQADLTSNHSEAWNSAMKIS